MKNFIDKSSWHLVECVYFYLFIYLFIYCGVLNFMYFLLNTWWKMRRKNRKLAQIMFMVTWFQRRKAIGLSWPINIRALCLSLTENQVMEYNSFKFKNYLPLKEFIFFFLNFICISLFLKIHFKFPIKGSPTLLQPIYSSFLG